MNQFFLGGKGGGNTRNDDFETFEPETNQFDSLKMDGWKMSHFLFGVKRA